MALVGKRHLWSPKVAKGARRHSVRINGIRVRKHMRDTIRSVGSVARFFRHRGTRVGISAAVEIHLTLARHKGSIFLHTRFYRHFRPWLANRFECLLGVERKSNRPTSDPRQTRSDAFGLDTALGAIATAHVGNDDAHGAERETEDPSQFLPHREWTLGRRPDLHNLSIELRHANMGLHRKVLRAGERKRIFKDKI